MKYKDVNIKINKDQDSPYLKLMKRKDSYFEKKIHDYDFEHIPEKTHILRCVYTTVVVVCDEKSKRSFKGIKSFYFELFLNSLDQEKEDKEKIASEAIDKQLLKILKEVESE